VYLSTCMLRAVMRPSSCRHAKWARGAGEQWWVDTAKQVVFIRYRRLWQHGEWYPADTVCV
jgi:hypothetical protein